MQICIEPDLEAIGCRAARIVADSVRDVPDAVLALPTGRTPLMMYRTLVRMHLAGEVDFAKVRVFSLDEFIGIARDDSRSFHHYLWEHFLAHINISAGNIHLASSSGNEAFCRSYEEKIRACGGIHLLIAGVGSNGHIAFNEPGSTRRSRTRIVNLAHSTVGKLRSIFDEEQLPRRAVTMGLATILEARRILVLAAGEEKKQPLQGLLRGPVADGNPASLLRLHKDVTVITDPQAGPPADDAR